ncbi:MAG: helix-turn-helix domain-containing protein [Lautropia sp.]
MSKACGVTPFHLAHAFVRRAGTPLVKYLRGRRLSVAARALAEHRTDILDLALESGYASHEAFSRAFRSQFDVTPQSVRAAASTEHLALVAPLELAATAKPSDVSPVRTSAGAFVCFGVWHRLEVGDASAAAGLWQSFMAQAHGLVARGGVPVGIGRTTPDPDVVDYACAVLVDPSAPSMQGMSRIDVPARDYAVFEHRGHVSAIGATYAAIWDAWPVDGRLRIDEGGLCLERHMSGFDPSTGLGGVEIWMPLQAG